MSATDTKPAFGATVVPTNPPNNNNTLQPSSPALTPAASDEDMAETYHTTPAPIHSPFYQHPPASFERPSFSHTRQTSLKNSPTTNEKDLEAQTATTPLTTAYTGPGNSDDNPFSSRISLDYSKECKMWPSRTTLMQSKLADKRRKRDSRRCGAVRGAVQDAWGARSKKQKLSAKIVLAVVVCGIMVAIGVGITNAVHGGVWSGESRTTPLGDDPGR